MVDKELIGIWKKRLKPSISSWLLKTNYEGLGEQDKEEFERDFDEILDLALIGLNASGESKPMSDLIERQAVLDLVKELTFENVEGLKYYKYRCIDPDAVRELPAAKIEYDVRFVDEDYVWIDGKRQYISIRRFQEAVASAKQDQKTALWIIRKWGDDAKCSNCGKTFSDVYDMENYDRYCRFCGCKMVGFKGEQKMKTKKYLLEDGNGEVVARGVDPEELQEKIAEFFEKDKDGALLVCWDTVVGEESENG